MSHLSYMEKLLDGVAIQWEELGSLCSGISSGKNKKKSEEGMYPVFGSTGIIGRTNIKVYEQTQILVARVGANAGRVNIAKGEYDVSDNTLIIDNKECVSLRYLYYFLVNINLNKFAQGAGQPLITAKQLKSILIPIPCPDDIEKSLAIQAEIVRILDTFTAMTAELTAELSMRKKQYNYYRDQLLSFEEGDVEWKTLGEISDFTYGYAAKAQESGDARFVRITDINTNGKLSPADHMYVDISEENERYLLKKDDLLMARTGATFGKTMIFEEDYPSIYAGFLIKLNKKKK